MRTLMVQHCGTASPGWRGPPSIQARGGMKKGGQHWHKIQPHQHDTLLSYVKNAEKTNPLEMLMKPTAK